MLWERPRLWGWVLAPAIVAALILGAVGFVIYDALDPFIASIASWAPDFLERWIAGFLRVVLVAVLVVGGYFVFFGVAALIAAPFNEMLSEAIEAELTNTEPPGFSLSTFTRDLFVGMVHALRRVAVYIGAIIAIFLVGLLVPVVGTLISIIAGAFLTVRFAAFDAMDAVWARRGYSYRQKTDYLRAHADRCHGVGIGVSLMMLVPGLNLVALSAGAVGATLLAIDVDRAAAQSRLDAVG